MGENADVCLDCRAHGYRDTVGVCNAKTEVLNKSYWLPARNGKQTNSFAVMKVLR